MSLSGQGAPQSIRGGAGRNPASRESAWRGRGSLGHSGCQAVTFKLFEGTKSESYLACRLQRRAGNALWERQDCTTQLV